MTDPERLSKLIGLLAIAFCWAHITGEWLNELEPIEIKKHGRKAISIFRYGFDHLREMVFNIYEKYHEFKEMVELLRKYLTSYPLPFSDKMNPKNKCCPNYLSDQFGFTIKSAIAA